MMRVTNFISRRWGSSREQPRSVRLMQRIAAAGIAVAVAALVIAVAIGRGFEKTYRQALLDFNAHMIVMGPGEFEPTDEVRSALAAYQTNPDAEQVADRYGFLQGVARATDDVYGMLIGLYETFRSPDATEQAGTEGGRLSFWDPRRLQGMIPNVVRESVQRLNAALSQGIVAQTPFLYREALAVGGGAIRGIVVKGVDPATLTSVSGMKIETASPGQSLTDALTAHPGKPLPAIVGKALATQMGIASEGGSMRIMIPRDARHAKGLPPFVEIRVVGTFASGLHDYDAEFILMQLPDVRRLFETEPHVVTGIELKLSDPDRAALIAPLIEERLGPAYHAVRWDELNADLLAAVRLEKLVSAIIMSLMLLVASLNIVSALVLNTLRRMSGIAILKAIGLSNQRTERILVRSGVRIGTLGVIVGMAVGLAVSLVLSHFSLIPLDEEIYLVGSLPVDISGPICGIIFLFCFGTLALTSRSAARRLSAVPPMEGLARAR